MPLACFRLWPLNYLVWLRAAAAEELELTGKSAKPTRDEQGNKTIGIDLIPERGITRAIRARTRRSLTYDDDRHL